MGDYFQFQSFKKGQIILFRSLMYSSVVFNVLMNPLYILYQPFIQLHFHTIYIQNTIHCTILILSSIHYYNTVSFITN